MSKVAQNSTAFKNLKGCFSVFHLDETCRTQFRSRYVSNFPFAIFPLNVNVVRYYNEHHYGNRPVMALGDVSKHPE